MVALEGRHQPSVARTTTRRAAPTAPRLRSIPTIPRMPTPTTHSLTPGRAGGRAFMRWTRSSCHRRVVTKQAVDAGQEGMAEHLSKVKDELELAEVLMTSDFDYYLYRRSKK